MDPRPAVPLLRLLPEHVRAVAPPDLDQREDRLTDLQRRRASLVPLVQRLSPQATTLATEMDTSSLR
jgi:hypothetical protein